MSLKQRCLKQLCLKQLCLKQLWMVGLVLAMGGSSVAAQSHGAEPIAVPLRMEDGRLIVPIEASDGTQLEFIVSTGNDATVLSESTAALLGDDGTLTMAGVHVPTEDSRTVPDADLSADGMIGANTLNQFDALFDLPGERLLLKPVGRSAEWPGVHLSDPVRVRVLHGTFLGLDVELNGTAFKGMLDLGTRSLWVNEPVKAAAHLGTQEVATLGLGSLTTPELPVKVDTDGHPLFSAWDAGNNGFVVVGAAMLKDCALSISWVHREIRTCVR